MRVSTGKNTSRATATAKATTKSATKKAPKKASAVKAPAKAKAKATAKATAKAVKVTATAKANKATASKVPVAAKAATARAKAVKVTPLDEHTLLERSLGAIAEVSSVTWRAGEDEEVIAAMDVCRAAGRVDLARALAEGVPTALRGRVLVSLVLAGDAAPDEAVDAILGGLSRARVGYDACLAAAFALDAARLLPGASGRKALMDAAGVVVDRCLAAGSLSGFEQIVRAYFELGERERVAALIRGTRGELSESLASGVWALESPAEILARVDRDNAYAALEAPWVDLAGWSIGEISQLADVANGTWARPQLAGVLMTLGRVDDARTLVIDDPEWDTLHLTGRLERYAVVGDAAALAKLLREAAPPDDEFRVWAKLQVEHGLRGYDDLWLLAAKRDRKSSVMSPIHTLTILVHDELDAGTAPARVGPALAAIDALFADPFRTQYDRGVEGSRRNEVATLRARHDILSGDPARAQAQVEADLKDVSTLLAFAKDAYARAGLLRGLLGRAAMVGRPDIALKVAKLIPPSFRSESAAAAARAFLPGAPGEALHALDRVASDPARRLLAGRGLLAGLWSAVLAGSVLAGGDDS